MASGNVGEIRFKWAIVGKIEKRGRERGSDAVMYSFPPSRTSDCIRNPGDFRATLSTFSVPPAPSVPGKGDACSSGVLDHVECIERMERVGRFLATFVGPVGTENRTSRDRRRERRGDVISREFSLFSAHIFGFTVANFHGRRVCVIREM